MTDKIDSALIQAFDDAGFGLPFAVENESYTPVTGTPYAQLFILPNQPTVSTMGDSGQDLITGLMQVNLNYPVGDGSGLAKQKATAIRNVFKAGYRPSYDGQEVFITSSGRGIARNQDSWYQVVVNIIWEARVTR